MAKPLDRQQLMDFFKRASEELKRTGEDLRTEAQRLIDEMRDPRRQARVKEQLEELRTWGQKAVSDASGLLETAVRRVETALRPESAPSAPPRAARPPAAPPRTPAETAPAAPAETVTESGELETPAPAKPRRAAAPKSIGRKQPAAKGASKQAPAKKAAAARKSVGRKPRAKSPAAE